MIYAVRLPGIKCFQQYALDNFICTFLLACNRTSRCVCILGEYFSGRMLRIAGDELSPG